MIRTRSLRAPARGVRRAGEAGVSLVEVLVALFVLGVLAAAGLSLLSMTLDSGEELEASSDRLKSLQVARATLKEDIGQLVARPARPAEGGRAPFIFFGGQDGPDDPILAFTRAGWDNPDGEEPRGDLQYVEYRIVDDALVRVVRLRPDASTQTPERERVLLTGINRFEVTFSPGGGVWQPAWRVGAGEDATADLPAAVAVDLDIDGVGGVRQLFMTPEAS